MAGLLVWIGLVLNNTAQLLVLGNKKVILLYGCDSDDNKWTNTKIHSLRFYVARIKPFSLTPLVSPNVQ